MGVVRQDGGVKSEVCSMSKVSRVRCVWWCVEVCVEVCVVCVVCVEVCVEGVEVCVV